jgi:hypothetical protein
MTHVIVCNRCGHHTISEQNRVTVTVETDTDTTEYHFHTKCWNEIHKGFKATVELEPHER